TCQPQCTMVGMNPNDVIKALTDGDMAGIEAAIAPELREHIPMADLKRMWDDAGEQLGALVDQGEQVVMYDTTLNFEKGIAHLQIVYVADKLTGILLRPGHPSARFGE
ncbi:MAG: hypothetical protein QOD63_348, partial [Actinomycetota bacterium]|nr:hypothetical protein [Actinomycetota bacterium]